MTAAEVLLRRLELLADDVGRLRRRLPPGTPYTGWLVERIADHVDALDARARPTAAEHYRSGVPLDEALAKVDREAAALRRRLGLEEAS